MTFGQKIKKLRTDANLTQKELAEKMNTSFQTISKWESDLNEPDISSIKELSKIFNCSFEYLLGDDEEQIQKPISQMPVVPTKTKIGNCKDCSKELFDGDVTHNIERRTASGVKEIITICDECFLKHEKEIDDRIAEINKSIEPDYLSGKLSNTKHGFKYGKKSKVMIWSIIVGVLAFVSVLIVCIVFNKIIGIGLVITLPILAGYLFFSGIYCIFTDTWISELFMEIASWSIKMPGIIFSFSLDGLKFLIFMKIFLWLLGIALTIGVFLLAFAISAICSAFAFPFLIGNK